MIQFIIISNSKNSLLLYVLFLKRILIFLGIQFSFSGILKRKKKLVILKSPHVYKKSKEHFELNKYIQYITLDPSLNLDLSTFKYFLQNKPRMITLKIKKIER